MPGTFGAIQSASGGTPKIQEFSDSAATFDWGNVVILTAGLLVEAGANPAAGTILGVTMSKAGNVPGRNMANDGDIVARTWADRKNSVYIAKDNVFKGKMISAALPIIAPVAADVGVGYGITATAAGTWYVDKSKTVANARVTITKIDIENLEVWFEFIDSFCVNI